MTIVPVIYFLFGLIVGSFLNVVLYRTEKETSLGGRSHCPHCQGLIHWYDNIPVLSFIFLQGKCRSCGGAISWQYPLVELTTGLLFGLAGYLIFELGNNVTWLQTAWWCFLFSIFLLITVYDLRSMEIPVSFLTWGIAGTLLYLILATGLSPDAESFWTIPIVSGLIGGTALAAFFYLLVWMSHERWMGMGDVWLALLTGMAVGPRFVLILLTLSFTLGAIVAITLLIFKKKELSHQVPFAPYLCLATIILLVLSVHPPVWLSLFLFPPV